MLVLGEVYILSLPVFDVSELLLLLFCRALDYLFETSYLIYLGPIGACFVVSFFDFDYFDYLFLPDIIGDNPI